MMTTQPPVYRRELSGGTLTVIPNSSNIPLDSLFDIAERRNPKRAFLLLAKFWGGTSLLALPPCAMSIANWRRDSPQTYQAPFCLLAWLKLQ